MSAYDGLMISFLLTLGILAVVGGYLIYDIYSLGKWIRGLLKRGNRDEGETEEDR